MPKEYKVGDTVYRFPDDFTDDQAADVLKKQGIIKPEIDTTPHSVTGFLKNVPASAMNLAGGIASTVLHPIDTATGLAKLGAGAVQKAARSGIEATTGQVIPPLPQEANVDALAEAYKKRYGGLTNIGETLYHDPVGAAADISTVLGIGGGMAKGLAQIPAMAKLAPVAKGLSTAATFTDPLSVVPLAGRGIGALTAGTRNKYAELIYGSALKPSGTDLYKARQIVKTGLENGIPVSEAGLRKAQAILDDYASQVSEMVDRANKLGVKVDPARVADTIYTPSPQTGKSTQQVFIEQVNPQDDLVMLEQARQKYLERHTPATPTILGPTGKPLPPPPPAPYPIAEAQAEKMGTPQRLGKTPYGERKGADVEAQKALVHGLKVEIENELSNIGITGIKDVNKLEGEMIALTEELKKAAAKEAKSMPGQFGGPLFSAFIGESVGGPAAGAVLGTIRYMSTHPAFASYVAQFLSTKAPTHFPATRQVLSQLAEKTGQYATPVSRINLAQQSAPYVP